MVRWDVRLPSRLPPDEKADNVQRMILSIPAVVPAIHANHARDGQMAWFPHCVGHIYRAI